MHAQESIDVCTYVYIYARMSVRMYICTYRLIHVCTRRGKLRMRVRACRGITGLWVRPLSLASTTKVYAGVGSTLVKMSIQRMPICNWRKTQRGGLKLPGGENIQKYTTSVYVLIYFYPSVSPQRRHSRACSSVCKLCMHVVYLCIACAGTKPRTRMRRFAD